MSFQVTTEQVVETCYKCAIVFSMPADFQRRRLNDHSLEFYCPAGHAQYYTGKTPLQKAQDEIAAAKAEAERQRQAAIDARCDAQGARLKAERIERKLKRVRNGVCSECNRSFENLGRHMADKHPGCVARAK